MVYIQVRFCLLNRTLIFIIAQFFSIISRALCDNQNINLPHSPRILLVDQISPGISSSDWQLGAEVQVENKIARRCSYEEMVHEDPDDDLVMMTSADLAMTSPSPEGKF